MVVYSPLNTPMTVVMKMKCEEMTTQVELSVLSLLNSFKVLDVDVLDCIGNNIIVTEKGFFAVISFKKAYEEHPELHDTVKHEFPLEYEMFCCQ